MVTLYKLTEQGNTTHRGTMTWGNEVTNSVAETPNPQLCTSDVIHAYESIEQALLMNPVHANIKNFRLWIAEGDVVVHSSDKVGVFSLTTIQEVELPDWYNNLHTRQRVQTHFAVLCAECVLHLYEKEYPDDNRPAQAIRAAKNCLDRIPNAAASAASAAASAADDADDAYAAAYAAASAAYAAAYAYAAASAASAAALNTVELASQAVMLVTGDINE